MALLQCKYPVRPALNRREIAGLGLAVPRLSVVIVNYRQWENTAALVRQVRSAPGAGRGEVELMVVDNHSPPHRLLRRLRRWPEVSLRRWGRNRGFARAANEGCRLSQGQWFLLLNPDVSVTSEFIQGVLDLADNLQTHQPRAGIVGFRLRNSDGSGQLSTGQFPTLAGTLAGLAQPRHRRKYQVVPGQERHRVPWVTGCCLLLRGDCWRDLGGFDENFFLYYEDVDLCRRAWTRGWSVWFEPNLQAIHHHPLHGRDVPPALRLVTRHSLLTYAARHWAGWQFRVLAGIVGLEAWVRRFRAWGSGDGPSAGLWRELAHLTANLAHAQPQEARRRLEKIISQLP